MGHRHLSKEEKSKRDKYIVELYNKGYTLSAIAASVGYGVGLVNSVLHDTGVERRREKRFVK